MQDRVGAILRLCDLREIEAAVLRRAPRAPGDADGDRVECRQTRYARDEVRKALDTG